MKYLSEDHIKTALRLMAITMLSVAVLSACAGPQQEVLISSGLQENQAQLKKETNGIQVVRIGHAVNGMMLDLRYRITDFEQAREIFKRSTTLSLLDQATGTVMAVAESGKIGKLRNVPQNDDLSKVYWVFFVNAGRVVNAGDRVTLIIGDLQIKDIVVE